MAIYAQIASAIFALMAAALWLGAAFVRTPRSFSVQVTTWHTHNSGNVDGSETAGGGHRTSDELVTLGTALAWQSRLNAGAAALAALSATCQGGCNLASSNFKLRHYRMVAPFVSCGENPVQGNRIWNSADTMAGFCVSG